MRILYNIVLKIVWILLRLVGLFNSKIKLFVQGRDQVFNVLESSICPGDNYIWIHVASLGEFEQGFPIMQAIKSKYPNYKLVVTFFSPSGYQVRKNNKVADVTIYLPWDTQSNVKRFLDLVNPKVVLFVKYEFWINYLSELKEREIPTYLVSGIFREKQMFFKPYGGFYRKALKSFTYFFVQNDSSKNLLSSIGLFNVSVSGDTRFDRVFEISKANNNLDFVSDFKGDLPLLVVGSSWEADEKILVEFINATRKSFKIIIAPHNIKHDQINLLRSQIIKKTVLYSEKDTSKLNSFDVMIVDTVGLLTKIYSYADIAYVGGGFGNPGVHNVLEPAVFSVPVVIGPNYSHFAEAISMVNLKAVTVIKNSEELSSVINKFLDEENSRKIQGKIAGDFVESQTGATHKIMEELIKVL